MLNNKPQSSKIALLAFFCWLISLCTPALVFYNHNESSLWGFHILATGWLGIFTLTISWYANIFFLHSCFKTYKNKSLHFNSAWIALLLAASMFLLRELVAVDEHNLLYGYGIGSLFWLVAMSLNLVAVGIKDLEFNHTKFSFSKSMPQASILIPLVLIFIYSSIYLVLGISDHKKASIAEDYYLKHAVFKIGPVCELPDIKPTQTIKLDEPLEIIADKYSPLEHPNILLSWGIPTVRKNGFNYSLENPNDINTIIAKPSKEYSTTELTQVSGKYGYGDLSIKLVKSRGGKEVVALDSHWPEPIRGGLRCPRYIDDHETMEPLRSLITSSLTSANGATIKPISSQRQAVNTPSEKLTIISSTIKGLISLSELETNIGCSKGNGLFNTGNHPISDLDWLSENIYIHDGVIRFPLLNFPSDKNWALCKNNEVYLLQTFFTSSLPAYPDILRLDKRNIDNFQSIWDKPKEFTFNRFSLNVDTNIRFYKPLSINELTDKTFVMQIVGFALNSTSGYVIELKAKR